MDRILVSACLLGSRVRYDGRAKTSDDAQLAAWRAEGRLVSFCPEVSGGLPIPRPPAEIEPGCDALGVLDGTARVLTPTGDDVSQYFVIGAYRALNAARAANAVLAILKESSPSCGSLRRPDGTFGGHTIPGEGVTTALLTREGIPVFSEERIPDAAAYLATLHG